MVGETELVPAATGVTEPMLLSSVNEVEFVVVHESVEESPELIEAGFAESVQVGADGGGVTLTFVVQVTLPPGPFAVPV